MATNIFIAGLSGRGFRVKDSANSSASAICKEGVVVQVDLDDRNTQQVLTREKSNFIRVASGSSTTATITGLSRVGFRIKNNAGTPAWVNVNLGSGVTTVNLAIGNTRRILRRAKGAAWIRSSGGTTAVIRGLLPAQRSFYVKELATGSFVDATNANPTTGQTVIIGTKTYTFRTTLTEVRATAVLSSDGTIPTDNDTVVVNNITYRLKGTLAQINDVHLVTSSDVTLDNIVKAVNQSGVAGTDYFTGTVAPTNVSAGARSGTGATGKITFTAAVGTGVAANAYPSTETSSHLSYSGVVFGTGAGTVAGVAPIANEVHLGADGDATLTNLGSAINGTGGTVGTDYSSGTVASTQVTAGAEVTATHTLPLTAVVLGDGGNAIPISTNATVIAASAATLAGGLTQVKRGTSTTVDLTVPFNYQQLRRHHKSWVEA